MPNIIAPGVRLVDDKLVHISEKEHEDRKIPDDLRTMQIISEIANKIDANTQVTFDVPSKNDDGYVPILDVKVRVNEIGEIDFKYYQKPSANTRVTLKSSALSMKSKITTLSQECFRRLHNTRESHENSVVVNTLDEFMEDLKMFCWQE